MPDLFTPMTDGEMGRAEAVNSRLRQIQAAIQGNPGALIARTPWTTLAANQASITVDVSAGHNVLELQACLRTDRAGNQIDSVLLTLNDDTASTYTARYGYFDGTGAASGYVKVDASGTTGLDIAAAAAGATAFAGQYSFLRVKISQASSATGKYCAIDGISDASYPSFVFGSGYYPNPVSIVRLKLTPKNGTVFMAGSRYALFGMG